MYRNDSQNEPCDRWEMGGRPALIAMRGEHLLLPFSWHTLSYTAHRPKDTKLLSAPSSVAHAPSPQLLGVGIRYYHSSKAHHVRTAVSCMGTFMVMVMVMATFVFSFENPAKIFTLSQSPMCTSTRRRAPCGTTTSRSSHRYACLSLRRARPHACAPPTRARGYAPQAARPQHQRRGSAHTARPL